MALCVEDEGTGAARCYFGDETGWQTREKDDEDTETARVLRGNGVCWWWAGKKVWINALPSQDNDVLDGCDDGHD